MRAFCLRLLLGPAILLAGPGCAVSGARARAPQPALQRDEVLVPSFEVRGGLPPKDGERVAAAFRSRIERSPTHTAYSGKVIRGAQRQLRIRQLDAPAARRLATQIGAELLARGTLQVGGPGLVADVDVIDARTGDYFGLRGVSAPDAKTMGELLYQSFQQALLGTQVAATCREEVAGDRFEEALASCERAIEAVPTSSVALSAKAGSLLALRRYREALDAHERALQISPDAPELTLGAGLAASGLPDAARAAGYYDRYLAAHPARRAQVAQRIAQVGDYAGAFRIAEPLSGERASDPEFQRFLFNLAAAAGEQAQQARDTATARRYFESALRTYAAIPPAAEPSREERGRLVSINVALGRTEEAIRLGREIALRHDTVPALWAQYAGALAIAGQHDEAARALTRVIDLDPSASDAYVRRGMAHLAGGRTGDGLADLERAAALGMREEAARVLFREGGEAVSSSRFGDAVQLLGPAYEYAPAQLQREIAFFLGYSLVKEGEAMVQRTGGRTAGGAARGALELFRRALTVLRDSTHQNAAQVRRFAEQHVASLEGGGARR